jgi:hypothetical protein
MDEFANHINTFVRVFASLNSLFCHVRWLEANLRNSSSLVLIVVGGIAGFSFFYLLLSKNPNLTGFQVDSNLFQNFGLLLLVIIICVFLYLRLSGGNIRGGAERVLFGDTGSEPLSHHSLDIHTKSARINPTIVSPRYIV